MANNYFTVSFPTKPFLLKYMQALYGHPLIFTTENHFGMILASCIEKKVYRDRSEQKIRNRFDNLTTSLTLHMPAQWLRNYYHGTDFTREKIIFINKLIEERFREDLYRYCFLLDILSIDRQEALLQFAAAYNIQVDEDITFDNLKKMEYRYRQTVEKTLCPPKHQPIQANVL